MDKSVHNTSNMTYIVCIFGTYAIYTVKWLNKVDTKNYFYSKNNWTYMQVLYNFVSFKSLLSTWSSIKNYKANIDTNKELKLSVQTF